MYNVPVLEQDTLAPSNPPEMTNARTLATTAAGSPLAAAAAKLAAVSFAPNTLRNYEGALRTLAKHSPGRTPDQLTLPIDYRENALLTERLGNIACAI